MVPVPNTYSSTKVLEKLLLKVLFADVCALVVYVQENLQSIRDKFLEASQIFNLIISLDRKDAAGGSNTKALIFCLWKANKERRARHVSWMYRSSNGSLGKEIYNRTQKAKQSLG